MVLRTWLIILFLSPSLGAQDLVVRSLYHEDVEPLWKHATFLGPSAQYLTSNPLPTLGDSPGYFTFSYLRKVWDFPNDLTATGTGTIFLPSRGYLFSEREFLNQFISFLKDQRSNDQLSFKIEGLDLPKDLPPQAEFKWTGGSQKDMINMGRCTAAWRAVGGPWKPGQTLSFYYRPFLILPLAATELVVGENLDDGNLTWEIVDVTKVYGRPLDLSEGSWAATRQIRKGEVLREGSVKPVFAVNKAQQITLQITKGTLSIEMAAQALEDGKIGNTLRVRTMTGKNFNAVVLDKSLARVELP